MTTTDPLFGMLLAFSASPGQQLSPLILLPYAAIIAIFYFIIVVPSKRQRKKVAEFLAALKVGDKVITSGGIYGSIAKITDDAISLQVAQNVRIDIARAAIVGYQGQAPVVETPNT